MNELKRGRWSTPELARLRALFPTTRIERLASLLGRTVETVRVQAHRLFRREPDRGPWDCVADACLRRAWGVVEPADIAVIVGRTVRDVRQRARAVRAVRRTDGWSSVEIALLKDVYAGRTDAELEVCFSRTRVSIAAKARELCLRKDKHAPRRGTLPMPRWTAPEVDRLIGLYRDTPNLEIARAIGRSVTSVANKASQLGLTKSESLRSQVALANSSARRRG